MNEKSTKEYWNNRVKEYGKDLQGVVLTAHYFNEFDKRTRALLSLFTDKKVLDMGCGYGRLSDMFTQYTGFDFSEEMVNLAHKENPRKNIQVGDFDSITEQYDVIFEAMCLSSFEMTPKQFFEKVKGNAKIVICCEPNEFNIFYA